MRAICALQETPSLGEQKVNSPLQLCVVINKRRRTGNSLSWLGRHNGGIARSQLGKEWPSSKNGSMCKGKKQQGPVKVVQSGKRTGSPAGLAVCAKGWS